MQETINWKYSNPGKIRIFTISALTKIHTYCLKILKSTDYHICLKFWTFRFDLRKKRTFANQTTENEIWQFWTSKCQPDQSGKVFNGLFYKKKTVAREKLDTVSTDEWSLERMKEQDPRWERVKRSFSQQLTRSTYQKDSIAVANSQKIRKNAQNARSRHHKIEVPWCSGYHICLTRRRSPVRCRLESNCLRSICEYCTQEHF